MRTRLPSILQTATASLQYLGSPDSTGGRSAWCWTLSAAHSVADYDPLCRWYADAAGCVVAAVDYDLAPQHKYPVQVEQAYAALRWLAANAADLGVRADRISVGGTSSGGALAAAVALMARDRGGPALCFHLLEIR